MEWDDLITIVINSSIANQSKNYNINDMSQFIYMVSYI